MSLTFTSWTAQLINIMAVASSEGRLYRELDLLSVRVTDTSVSCSSGVRTIALSTTQGTFLVLERLNMLTSAGAPSSVATRNPIMMVTADYVDAVYPSAASSNTGLPIVAARISDTTLILGPTPDRPYGTEQYGTQRPTPLSSGNSSTWLTQNVPELFMAATMVFAAGFMRDFGAGSDNPQMAMSWEQTYKTLFASANVDQLRAKYQSQAWSNQTPNPIATPPRV
jgi:hypothetical protein